MRRLLLFLCFFALPLAVHASETPAEHAANVYAAQELAAAPLHTNVPDYVLLPADLAKAQHLSTIHVTLHFVEEAWGSLSLILLLWLGVIGWMRDRAVALGQISILQKIMFPVSFLELTILIAGLPIFLLALSHMPNKTKPIGGLALFLLSALVVWLFIKSLRSSSYMWVEGHVFFLLYLVAGFLVSLPLDVYSQHLSLAYGLSVQSWASWFGDQAKSLAIGWIFGGLILMLLFWIIRKLPNKWWLLFWGFSIPIVLAGVFITPYVIDPLFNKFEPLQKTNPELVARLEQVVQRGHMDIPPERMFLMKASAKVTTLNAYVTGFGASKRVVVWDTSLAKGTPDEVVFIFGHESGHYVLGHIPRGIAFTFLILLVALYLGYRFVQWAIAKFGPAWRVPSQNDWGALAVLLLAFSIFSVVLEPIQNTFSRQQEHAADVYGQEAIHGLVADPQTTAKGAFDVLGATSYADPNPSPLYEFWTYSHPSIGRRAAFAHAYNPWAPGMEPKYFPKQ